MENATKHMCIWLAVLGIISTGLFVTFAILYIECSGLLQQQLLQ